MGGKFFWHQNLLLDPKFFRRSLCHCLLAYYTLVKFWPIKKREHFSSSIIDRVRAFLINLSNFNCKSLKYEPKMFETLYRLLWVLLNIKHYTFKTTFKFFKFDTKVSPPEPSVGGRGLFGRKMPMQKIPILICLKMHQTLPATADQTCKKLEPRNLVLGYFRGKIWMFFRSQSIKYII